MWVENYNNSALAPTKYTWFFPFCPLFSRFPFAILDCIDLEYNNLSSLKSSITNVDPTLTTVDTKHINYTTIRSKGYIAGSMDRDDQSCHRICEIRKKKETENTPLD